MPQPLPPAFSWSNELAAVLSEAVLELGRLDGVSRQLPNPHLLFEPFVRREAVLSSRIEGTQASLSDVFLFDVSPAEESKVPDVREVANYVRSLHYGLGRLEQLPLGLRLIRELHEHLMAGGRGEDRMPGEFRRVQNFIGPPGCRPAEATFVPPPPPEMNEALEAFEAYLHTPSDLPPLIQLALIHYQFETIHPFLDGNGRVGRLLITLWLCSQKLLSHPLLYLSAYFERRRKEYYAHLLAVSQMGAWAQWAAFFLRGVAEQAVDAVERSKRLLSLREECHERLHTARRSALTLKLVDHLFGSPVTTVTHASRLLNITYPTAQKHIDNLVEAGILREATGRKWRRVFVAEEILGVIEKPLSVT